MAEQLKAFQGKPEEYHARHHCWQVRDVPMIRKVWWQVQEATQGHYWEKTCFLVPACFTLVSVCPEYLPFRYSTVRMTLYYSHYSLSPQRTGTLSLITLVGCTQTPILVKGGNLPNLLSKSTQLRASNIFSSYSLRNENKYNRNNM